jgi:hypothetical protein
MSNIGNHCSPDYTAVDMRFMSPKNDFNKLGIYLEKRSFEVNPRFQNRVESIYIFTCLQTSSVKLAVSFMATIAASRGGFTVIFTHKDGRNLDVERWLQKNKSKYSSLQFWYSEDCDNSNQFVNYFLDSLLVVLETHFLEVISGKDFFETDVDWQGLK